MMIEILILIGMIFCHIVDDYYLQGWLASAKQKSWWEKNAPDELYKNDYKVALFMHSFSWSFMVMLVPTIFMKGFNMMSLALFLFNLLIHMLTDNAKANWKCLNLVQDQGIHMVQILITWLILIVL